MNESIDSSCNLTSNSMQSVRPRNAYKSPKCRFLGSKNERGPSKERQGRKFKINTLNLQEIWGQRGANMSMRSEAEESKESLREHGEVTTILKYRISQLHFQHHQ